MGHKQFLRSPPYKLNERENPFVGLNQKKLKEVCLDAKTNLCRRLFLVGLAGRGR
ncbi:MAG: hypothetical protein ABGX24_04875 [Aquificota bacterium]|jgi:hypothetical protein